MNKWLTMMLVPVMVCSLMLLVSGCGEAHSEAAVTEETALNTEAAPEETTAPDPAAETEVPMPGREIETVYFTLTVPEVYAEHIEHLEVTEGQTVMEVFSMTKAGDPLELFRIYFGDPGTGKKIGFLQVDGAHLPITITVCEYPDDAFRDEETVELYAQTMELLNHALDTIRNDPRYAAAEELPVEKNNEELTYWEFTLPENVQCEESVTDGVYRAVFYGLINGETYELYTLMVGEPDFGTLLGVYDVDGTEQAVSIESHELPDTQGWESEDEIKLYIMMDSINDVIQTIMGSEGFSEQTSDTP